MGFMYAMLFMLLELIQYCFECCDEHEMEMLLWEVLVVVHGDCVNPWNGLCDIPKVAWTNNL